jgi:lipopolysaccharide transport system permease protein
VPQPLDPAVRKAPFKRLTLFLVPKQYRQIIYFKAKIHLKSEASKTYLSFLWWAFEPIISMAVYYVVFGLIFQRGTEDFIPFLLIGLVTWQWFSNTTGHCASSINNNLALISQFYLPKIVLPSINVVMDSFKFGIVFLLLLVFLWVYGFPPSWAYIALPLVLISQHLFNTAIANFVAAAVPFIPDLQIIITNLLRVMMYLSGILYSIERLPESVQPYFLANPMVMIIDSYRAILMHQQLPEFTPLFIIAGVSFIGICLGTLLMKKLDPIFPRVLMQK